MTCGKPKRITQVVEEHFLSASRDHVVESLGACSIFADGSWVDSDSEYAEDSLKKIKKEFGRDSSVANPFYGQYLAASTFVHCADGWSYLGRALDAVIRGDLNTAVHLTYYAELRAAMSLLAGEGILIANGLSFSLDRSGVIRIVLEESTHVATWKCLDFWRQQPRAQELVFRILRPENEPLQKWVEDIGTTSGNVVIKELFKRMAFDLNSFNADKGRRNKASYEPNLCSAKTFDAGRSASSVEKVWASLEPDRPGGFPGIDRTILRNILVNAYRSTHPDSSGSEGDSASTTNDWKPWEKWLKAVLPEDRRKTALFGWLVKEGAGPETLELFDHDPKAKSPAEYIEPMIARTVVLLRIATGSCRDLIDESTLEAAKFRQWVNSLSHARGLWAANAEPEDTVDLWADVEVAASALEGQENLDHYALHEKIGNHLVTLGQAERVVAWSFA